MSHDPSGIEPGRHGHGNHRRAQQDDRVLLDLLDNARLITSFQVINCLRPELLEPALNGEHVGTIVRKG